MDSVQIFSEKTTKRHFKVNEVYYAKRKKLQIHHLFSLVPKITQFELNLKWLAQAGKVKNVEQLLPVNGVSPPEAPSVISKDAEDKPG